MFRMTKRSERNPKYHTSQLAPTNMDILQATVSNRVLPPDTGGYQRIQGLISGFDNSVSVDRYCCTGILATIYSEKKLLEQKVSVNHNLEELRCYSFWHDIPKAINELGMSRYYWTYLLNENISNKLFELSEGKDILIGEDPYTASALADLTDVPTVYSSHNVESKRYRQTNDHLLSKYLSDKITGVEKRACNQSDLVICTTDRDKEILSNYTSDIGVIPNGVSESKLSNDSLLEVRSELEIPRTDVTAVFIGTSYYPNIETCEWLIDNWAKATDTCHLLLVGNVSKDVDANQERVHKMGFVDDLSGLLNAVDIGLNPVVLGSGSNVKLLDYFAAELPVLSTPFGAVGFDISNERELLIRARDRFFDGLNWLVKNKDERQRLGRNGYLKASREYTWEKLSMKYQDMLENIIYS